MTADRAARRRREELSAKYRPDQVRLLLVAEAPPTDLSRYFYFEVGLTRAVYAASVLGALPAVVGSMR
jgi:hypothetical protein